MLAPCSCHSMMLACDRALQLQGRVDPESFLLVAEPEARANSFVGTEEYLAPEVTIQSVKQIVMPSGLLVLWSNLMHLSCTVGPCGVHRAFAPIACAGQGMKGMEPTPYWAPYWAQKSIWCSCEWTCACAGAGLESNQLPFCPTLRKVQSILWAHKSPRRLKRGSDGTSAASAKLLCATANGCCWTIDALGCVENRDAHCSLAAAAGQCCLLEFIANGSVGSSCFFLYVHWMKHLGIALKSLVLCRTGH